MTSDWMPRTCGEWTNLRQKLLLKSRKFVRMLVPSHDTIYWINKNSHPVQVNSFLKLSHENKQQKCSNDPCAPYLQNFFAVISLSQFSDVKMLATSCHLTAEWLHNLQLSHRPVTLNEGQGHSNRYQTVQFNGIYRLQIAVMAVWCV